VTALAPALQKFFTTRLTSQFGASPHTIAAYRDTWRLLLGYIAQALRIQPQDLDLSALTADVISGFLDHLETARGNSVTTRNARLAAIHSFCAYAACGHPEHAATISQVMAIPSKRRNRTDITYLTPGEVTALLAAPDTATRAGHRDHAMLQFAVTTGLRVSELTATTPGNIHLGTGAHVTCQGKGRKNRTTPLDPETVAVLHPYISSLPDPDSPLFPARSGTAMSTGAAAARLTLHTTAAASTCPTLASKNVTPHVLRHTAAMRLLSAGIDTTVIALRLGHESTETTLIYLHADMQMKQAALDRATPTGTRPGRYQPEDDALLAFLQNL
jgi:integrase/recombinase XerD